MNTALGFLCCFIYLGYINCSLYERRGYGVDRQLDLEELREQRYYANRRNDKRGGLLDLLVRDLIERAVSTDASLTLPLPIGTPLTDEVGACTEGDNKCVGGNNKVCYKNKCRCKSSFYLPVSVAKDIAYADKPCKSATDLCGQGKIVDAFTYKCAEEESSSDDGGYFGGFGWK